MTTSQAYFINDQHKLEDLNINTNGYGKLFVSNEDISFSYNGYIKDGQFDKFGLIVYTYNKINPTIVKYEGEFLANEYHGKGKLTYTNGDIFVGNFKNNMKHGVGKLYNSIGHIIIDNEWVNDIIYNKIKLIEYHIGTENIKLEGYLLNSVKVGPWIYYKENKLIDKIEYYKTYDNTSENTIVEVLESHINTNDEGYIISQKLNIDTVLTNYELINYKNYYNKKLVDSSIVDELQKISIKMNNEKSALTYFLQLNNNGNIMLISKTINNNFLNNLIIFLPNNKYLINNNNMMSIYQVDNQELCIYYDGEFNKNHLPHGNGIIYKNKQKLHKGVFNNGIIISGEQYNIEEPYNIEYNGTFLNNIPNGKGIYYNKNNNIIYIGEILNDKYHGNGISYWETTLSKKWEGKWQKGFKHGEGYLYDEQETVICHCVYEYDSIIEVL